MRIVFRGGSLLRMIIMLGPSNSLSGGCFAKTNGGSPGCDSVARIANPKCPSEKIFRVKIKGFT